jgi:TonB family protein
VIPRGETPFQKQLRRHYPVSSQKEDDMKSALVVVLVMLMSCTSMRPTDATADRTEVLSLAPLPPLTSKTHLWGVTLDVLFHLKSDGTVLGVKLLRSSGDEEWDTLAAHSMTEWRFAPLVTDGRVFDTWIKHRLIVQIQEPKVITIGELACARPEEADSLYSLATRGMDFTVLMSQVRQGLPDVACRCPGPVEIARYPRHIREELQKLKVNDMTPPLRLGPSFVIYKRFPDKYGEKTPE